MLWQARLGTGYSSCAVENGRVIAVGYDKASQQDVVYCFEAASGKELWRSSYPMEDPDPENHGIGGTLGTPALDGDLVFCVDREGWVRCLQSADGVLVWKRGPKELGMDVPRYGFAASPIVLEEQVVLNSGRVVALARREGRTLWKSKEYGDGYSTPSLIELGDEKFLAAFEAKGLAILALKDGHERDFVPWKAPADDANAMTPAILGSRVFISSGNGRGGALVDLAGKKPQVLWEKDTMENRLSSALGWMDHLYGFDGAGLKCINAAGEDCWVAPDITPGALSIAAGRLLIVTSFGALVIAEASPTGFRELSRRQVFKERASCWTAPVLSDGFVFLRSQAGELVVLDHRKE